MSCRCGHRSPRRLVNVWDQRAALFPSLRVASLGQTLGSHAVLVLTLSPRGFVFAAVLGHCHGQGRKGPVSGGAARKFTVQSWQCGWQCPPRPHPGPRACAP